MSTLNLTEFFNDDDSDGHRLAQFLQKRRGGVKQQNRLYLDCKTVRKSLKVQLEKLPQTQTKDPNKDNLCEIIDIQENVEILEKEIPDQDDVLQQNNKEKSVEEQIAVLHGETNGTASMPPPTTSPRTASPTSPSRNEDNSSEPPLSPSRNKNDFPEPPLSPIIPFITSRVSSPTSPLSPSRPVSPSRPLSPRLSAVLKSGGRISPGDRLRRLSLKRLTTQTHLGRRTLLREFENTVNDENFQPPVCSTPLSQQPITKPTSPSPSSPLDTENQELNSSNKPSPTSGESCCVHTDTLLQTLQRKDEELKKYMGNILVTTLQNMQHDKETEKNDNNGTFNMSKNQTSLNNINKSSLKRTYTVEKGPTPGQVILTPERNQSMHIRSHGDKIAPQNMSLRSRHQEQPPPSKIIKTPDYSANHSMISIRVKSPHTLLKSPQNHSKSLRQTAAESPKRSMGRSAIMLERATASKKQDLSIRDVSIIYPTQQQDQNNVEVKNTQAGNISIILPTQETMDIEIPETQEQPLTENENCLMIASSNTPFVVIPVNHTYNKSHVEQPQKNCTIITSVTKSMKKKSKTLSPIPTNVNRIQNKAEDQLRYTDIFTDDEEKEEDLTPKAVSSSKEDNNSQAPLNLATSAKNVRSKRLRKRSLTRRRLQMERSQLLSTETESERPPPPAAHTNNNKSQQRRLRIRIKKIPLNRAPGTPLNGERYAVELQRMSNYEILDLRKRNSMGRVFPLTGRISTRSQEEANKKQLQLDDDIEMELLRRKLEKSINNVNEKTTEEYPTVPEQFRDKSKQMEQEEHEQQSQLESSLVDEKSTDRISFKPNKSCSLKLVSKRRKAKSVPEVLKQYLEVTKLIKTKKKARKSKMNTTKRSLYTQGNSDSEEINANSSAEKQIVVNDKTNETTLQYIPSPPTSETDQMPELRVVSPPPPLSISLEANRVEERQELPELDLMVATDNEPQVEAEVFTEQEQQIEEFLAPPPAEFDSDSGVSSNNFNINHNPDHGTTTTTTIDINSNEDFVFKKPLPPPPVKTKNLKKSKKTNILVNDMQATEETNHLDTTVRRSKRQVSEKPVSIFTILYQENLNRRFQAREKRLAKIKEKNREMSKVSFDDNSTVSSVKSKVIQKSSKGRPKKLPTIVEDDVTTVLNKDMEILNTQKEEKTKKKKSKVKRTQQQNTEEQFECSKINLTAPPPTVDHFNNVFDQLSQAPEENNSSQSSSYSSAKQQNIKIKNLKVRLKRCNPNNLSLGKQNYFSSSTSAYTNNQLVKDNTTTTRFNSVSSSSCSVSSNQSNSELIAWLKNVTEAENCNSNEEIFKEMRISAASNLSFSNIQGVEYAFYDTDEKASLGYLRFKPGQLKPKKKAKRFNLHFVTLVGQFRITANDKEKRVGVGDMVAIDRSVYYDIENITDDIGILMVIKK